MDRELTVDMQESETSSSCYSPSPDSHNSFVDSSQDYSPRKPTAMSLVPVKTLSRICARVSSHTKLNVLQRVNSSLRSAIHEPDAWVYVKQLSFSSSIVRSYNPNQFRRRACIIPTLCTSIPNTIYLSDPSSRVLQHLLYVLKSIHLTFDDDCELSSDCCRRFLETVQRKPNFLASVSFNVDECCSDPDNCSFYTQLIGRLHLCKGQTPIINVSGALYVTDDEGDAYDDEVLQALMHSPLPVNNLKLHNYMTRDEEEGWDLPVPNQLMAELVATKAITNLELSERQRGIEFYKHVLCMVQSQHLRRVSLTRKHGNCCESLSLDWSTKICTGECQVPSLFVDKDIQPVLRDVQYLSFVVCLGLESISLLCSAIQPILINQRQLKQLDVTFDNTGDFRKLMSFSEDDLLQLSMCLMKNRLDVGRAVTFCVKHRVSPDDESVASDRWWKATADAIVQSLNQQFMPSTSSVSPFNCHHTTSSKEADFPKRATDSHSLKATCKDLGDCFTLNFVHIR